MALSGSGGLSKEAFNLSCISFLDSSRRCNMKWRLETVDEDTSYLSLLEMRSLELEDSPGGTIVSCQYDIVYSQSFLVPVLYFNMSKCDGRMLTLEQVWSTTVSKYSDISDLWTFVSQQDHPILHIPFFTLHPCCHEDIMNKLSSAVELTVENYLICWYSLVSSILGQKLPNSFAYAT